MIDLLELRKEIDKIDKVCKQDHKHRGHQITGHQIDNKKPHIKKRKNRDPIKKPAVIRKLFLRQNNLKQNLSKHRSHPVAAQKRNKQAVGGLRSFFNNFPNIETPP